MTVPFLRGLIRIPAQAYTHSTHKHKPYNSYSFAYLYLSLVHTHRSTDKCALRILCPYVRFVVSFISLTISTYKHMCECIQATKWTLANKERQNRPFAQMYWGLQAEAPPALFAACKHRKRCIVFWFNDSLFVQSCGFTRVRPSWTFGGYLVLSVGKSTIRFA